MAEMSEQERRAARRELRDLALSTALAGAKILDTFSARPQPATPADLHLVRDRDVRGGPRVPDGDGEGA